MRRLVTAVLMCTAPAFAYPIAPRTLWELTREAEAIVIADVGSVKELPPRATDDWPGSHQAQLSVRETLKGDAKGVVEVRYLGRMTCPAPPDYREAETVVAFLSKDEGRWKTVALSYGTRYPGDAASIAHTRHVIALASQLQAAGTMEPTTGWMLLATSHPSTRWDGLFALQHESDEMHSHYARRAPSEPLSPITIAAVESAFLERPSFDSTVPMMLKLLASRPSPAVTQMAADVLESVLLEAAPWWTEETMRLLEVRLGVAKDTPSHPPIFMSGDERKQAWQALKARARLKPTVRPDYRPPHPSRTGGKTPD
jgi:hypothetical protein